MIKNIVSPKTITKIEISIDVLKRSFLNSQVSLYVHCEVGYPNQISVSPLVIPKEVAQENNKAAAV